MIMTILIIVGLVILLFGAWVICLLKLNKELEDNKEE